MSQPDIPNALLPVLHFSVLPQSYYDEKMPVLRTGTSMVGDSRAFSFSAFLALPVVPSNPSLGGLQTNGSFPSFSLVFPNLIPADPSIEEC